MGSEKPSPSPAARPPVFAISCWALGLMAFVQLLVAALALATKFEESRQTKTLNNFGTVTKRVIWNGVCPGSVEAR